MELVTQEIVLRQERGDAPRLEEYLADFPELADHLRELFDLNGAIGERGFGRDPSATVPNADGTPREPAADRLPAIPGIRIERILGSGGMGIVYLATSISLERKVALKLMRRDGFEDPEKRKRFEREAAAAAKCQHPNLVQIYSVGEHQGEPFLALEYVDGVTLARQLAGSPQDPREAAVLVEKLARAIDHAHRRGVIHRDLKPANVLITRDGEPKITDFGLARVDGSSTRTEVGALLGTLAYMAPEQAGGGTVAVGVATDIHALGAILYEALTGRPPYRAENPAEVLQKILFEDVAAPSIYHPRVPHDLEAICLKCLQKAPHHRYGSAVELAEDLRRFLDGRPIVARPSGYLERSWRWCRRNPKLAFVTSALAATVLVAATALLALSYRHAAALRAENLRTRNKEADARRNYREASSTMEAMIDLLDAPSIKGNPRLIELQRNQRKLASAFYEQILANTDANDANDPDITADTIRALGQASMYEFRLGQADRAKQNVERALQLIERYRSKRGNSENLVWSEIGELMRLGSYHVALGSPDQALVPLRKSMELMEALVRAVPDNIVYEEHLATCCNSFATALTALHRDAEALPFYEKSTVIRQRIDPRKLPGVTQRLVASVINEGMTLWHENKPSLAEEKFRRAAKILLDIPPEQHQIGGNIDITLAQLYSNWSGALLFADRCDEAISRATAGLARIEPYLKIEPNDADARHACVCLHGNRALALAELNRHRESAAEWARVVEMNPPPVPPRYRIAWAIELVESGEPDRAADAAKSLNSDQLANGGDRYSLGVFYAKCAAAAKRDCRIGVDERAKLVESRRQEALHWLKLAAATGYFDDAKKRSSALEDPNLAILLDDPEFRRLLEVAPRGQ
jgi:serine/threonine protein kinase